MITSFKPTRGYRNNNPLNIRNSSNFKWEGQVGKDADGFCTFKSMLYGVRAAFALMRSYNVRHHCDTIRSIIERWAPPTENNTATYIEHVCKAARITPDERIHYRSPQMRSVVKAMGFIESNFVIDDALIHQAQNMIL